MRLCVVCGKRPAEVPDRNRPGRPVKRVCGPCHGARLLGDLRRVVAEHEKAKGERRGGI